ncbi:MAG: hypothetical protein ABS46_13725 [Cytophagaceae bacterium SCN 52-12]|nr:MAG: hypothetical protein ABS46_13725 [Cytophagaceae bacterium SCN 52-12]
MKTSDNLLRISDNDREIVLDPSNYSYINIGTGERIISALAGVALTAYGAFLAREKRLSKNEKWYQLAVLPVGMYLVKRGLTGYCAFNNVIGRNTAEQADFTPLELSAHVKVDKPRNKVYKLWKNPANMPALFPHIEKVEVTDNTHSTWTAGVPGTFAKIQWKAEITENVPGERISWQSTEGSDIGNAGEVRFRDAEGGGTDVEVSIRYIPPAGRLGKNVAEFFSSGFRKALSRELDALAGSHASAPEPADGGRV